MTKPLTTASRNVVQCLRLTEGENWDHSRAVVQRLAYEALMGGIQLKLLAL